MIERLFPYPHAQEYSCKDPLGPYVDGFLAQLAVQGYTAATTKEKLRLIAHLSRWLAHPLNTTTSRAAQQPRSGHPGDSLLDA